ncbi:MAG TPA: bifunctional nicotinamidase/pyrazinamidase [Bacteroidetes bacterium]|nr:bifunctional nicotinamidase/pyrazinamidase [Bacteroidota bacterium]
MDALILVDLQNDFVPGGALPVQDGDKVIPVANSVQPHFELVVATRDWHPANHGSFAANHPGKKPGDIIELNGLQQILWPVHCVQNTHGAEFVAGLETEHISKIFFKGTDPGIDSYSALYDNAHRKSTGLGEYLRDQGVDTVYVLGLATDYCVKFTVLDALAEGFSVCLIEDGCRGVNLSPEDSAKAVAEMREAGAEIITSTALGKATA